MDLRDDGIFESEAVDDDYRYGPSETGPEEDIPEHPLDAAKMEAVLHRLQEWHEQEWQRQAHNRFQQAMDEDYYDSMQWTEDDAMELAQRGQSPLVYNEIKSTIDWMIGTERRTKIDYKVLPRRKAQGSDAETKTQLMKYLDDVNQAQYVRSRVFADVVKAGLGWIEVGVRGDSTDEPIYYRQENWRNMLYDSNSVEADLSDSRYIFRWKWLDTDLAAAYFPDRKDIVKRAARDGNSLMSGEQEDDLWYLGARVTEPGQDYVTASVGKYRPYDGSAFAWSRRDRVKVYECWYVDPVNNKYIDGGDFDGEIYDKSIHGVGDHSLYDKTEMEMRVCLFTDAGVLYEGRSPYRHGKFPFVPVWCYRRKRDNAPYGPIRAMRDPQDDMNKRASKALWILSTNQIDMEEGAVADIEELREEAARADGITIRRKGFELTRHRDIQLAEEHLMLMDRDQRYIRNTGGVTDENLGRESNATSGKAIIARQDQGSVVTTEPFDNLRLAVQLAGQRELSLSEQYMTEEKELRILGSRGNPDFIPINQTDPETGEILNDVTANQADFIVSEQDYRDSLRIAMFESLFDIVSRLAQMSPDVALNLLDLVVDMADVPGREELVNRIRQINGQRDPDSDPTPEEMEREQQKAQLEAKQQQLALAKIEADLKETVAKGESLDARALMDKMKSMQEAINSAMQLASAPGIAPIADEMMRGAGFVEAAQEQPHIGQM